MVREQEITRRAQVALMRLPLRVIRPGMRAAVSGITWAVAGAKNAGPPEVSIMVLPPEVSRFLDLLATITRRCAVAGPEEVAV